jgi:hypothetical protein
LSKSSHLIGGAQDLPVHLLVYIEVAQYGKVLSSSLLYLIFAKMSLPCKFIPSHIPFYFATHYRSRHAPPAPRSTSQELEAQQTEDLNAHDLLPAELRKLKQDLKLYNNLGCMVTFNMIIKDWVVWNGYV